MNILFKLTDKDIGYEEKEVKDYKLRTAARGIILREDGKIAIQKNENTNQYKLIGGGIEDNEKPEIAFKREVIEEAGCEVEIIKQLGVTEEYISMQNAKQISHIFVAKVINDTHKLDLTEKEKVEGASLLWVEEEEALNLIKDCYHKLIPSDYIDTYDVYRQKFIALRDRKILEYYLENK